MRDMKKSFSEYYGNGLLLEIEVKIKQINQILTSKISKTNF
jgi:hypothetical protein